MSLESLGEAVRKIARETDFTHLEPGSQRNKDSVLHYFVAHTRAKGSWTNILPALFKFKVPHSGEYGTTLEEYLFAVKANVIDKATRVSSPRMIGHMLFHTFTAPCETPHWLNQNVVKLETAMTMTYLERETIAMLHREFFRRSNTFYDHHMHAFDRSLGVFTSGGTIANITAMWTARNKALKADVDASIVDGKKKKSFRGVEKEGLFKALLKFGYMGAVIIGSSLMHYSFKKAADLLGIGDEGLCLIPTDKDFRMRMDILDQKVKEFKAKKILIIAIVGIAGTTETGSIDNLSRISTIAREHKIHFHVDAAWGGPLIFSREHRNKLLGIAEADTITIDGHKQLYTPMGLGLILFRNPQDASHIRKSASYVIRHDSPDLGKFTLEGSRPATSLHLHASLHLLGRDGVESLVTRSATLVRQMAARLRTHPLGCFQTLHEPSTNILLYRYIPKRLRHKVAAMAPLEMEEDEEISDVTRRIQNRQAREEIKSWYYFVLYVYGGVPDRGVAGGRRKSPAGTPTLLAASLRLGESEEEEENEEEGTPISVQRRVDAFRVVIANPLTKWEDVEAVIAEQLVIGEIIEAEMAIERPQMGSEKVNMWAGWPFDM
ncbi:pyridoxal phosphate-dependent transferase [Chytridium lagenaria]|nr:pyridoxal phosphate-dependent transferase [Chytridium lagenaria]